MSYGGKDLTNLNRITLLKMLADTLSSSSDNDDDMQEDTSNIDTSMELEEQQWEGQGDEDEDEEEEEDEEEGAVRPREQPPRRAKKRKAWWMKDWYRTRDRTGWYRVLLHELQDGHQYDHAKDHKKFIRVDADLFQEFLRDVGPLVEKQDTNFRVAISVPERIAMTLRYLAVGDVDIQFGFKISRSSVMKIIPETLEAFRTVYGDRINIPETPEDWLAVSNRFLERWNFDHCLGAIDGKHVAIVKPKGSGSAYYNYKSFFSIILLAVADADYRFRYVEVGHEGSAGDAGIFRESVLRRNLENGHLDVPPPTPLPGDNVPVPYYLIGDGAFALRESMMTPFARRRAGGGNPVDERIFNYRLSRARRVVECSFGILSQRFRILMSTMRCRPKKAQEVVYTCCVLHNLLIEKRPGVHLQDISRQPIIPGVYDVSWHSDDNLVDLQIKGGNNQTTVAKNQRNHLKLYYNNVGRVTWQDRAIDLQEG